MKRYIILQIKRFSRVLPATFLAAAVLLVALGAIYAGALRSDGDNAERQPFRVALVGTGEDTILQMGISALSTMDDSRFAIELIEMEENDARDALQQGHIVAYVVFPEGFMDNAMYGNILPLRFVSPPGASNIGSILRIELTGVIADILEAAQRGTYGSVSAIQALGDGENPWPFAQELAISYVQMILVRGEVYNVQSLGISDGLGFGGYLLCGLFVLLILLCTLSFAPIMIRKDLSLNKLLAAKGMGPAGQVLCELGVYFSGVYILLSLMLTAVTAWVGPILSLDVRGIGLSTWLPVIFALTALSYLLYELSADVISGVLLQFFLYLFMCLVSGCFYPSYFFPEALQQVGSVLPAGLAKSYLAGIIAGNDSLPALLGLLAWGVVLVAAGMRLRAYRLHLAEVAV